MSADDDEAAGGFVLRSSLNRQRYVHATRKAIRIPPERLQACPMRAMILSVDGEKYACSADEPNGGNHHLLLRKETFRDEQLYQKKTSHAECLELTWMV